MASKSINVDIDGKKIPVLISRLKKKEVKEFSEKIAGKLDEFTELFAKHGGKDADGKEKTDVSALLYENLDFICTEIVKPFTTLSSEQLDEMDVADIASLVKIWLEYNGINVDVIQNFIKHNLLASFFPAGQAGPQPAEAQNFNGKPIPLSLG